jgi:hypothetical protein
MFGVTSCVRSTARTFDRKALCSPLRGAARRYAVMGSGVQREAGREQERRVAFGYTGARW